MKILRYLLVIAIASMLMASCGYPDHLKTLPKETIAVVSFDLAGMAAKGDLDKLQDAEFYKKMQEKLSKEDTESAKETDEFLKNPLNYGINFIEPVYLFVINNGLDKKPSVGFSIALGDAEKFKTFIANFEDLKERFKEVSLIFEPRTIFGYSIGVKQMYGDGYVLCGNSTEFLDPVFSSGVTLATFSGLQAAKLAHQQISGNPVDWKNDYEEVVKKGVDVFRSYVKAWYNGDLQTIFFAQEIQPQLKNQICSVLAGYVWDETNPFIKKHNTVISTLAKVVRMKENA